MTIRVDTMRRIDHLAGVPLCAILTPIVYLYDFIRGLFLQQNSTPKKVLFIELSEMGSAILVDPAMRETIRRGADIYFLIFKSNQVSLDLLQTVPKHQILTIDSSGILSLIKTTFLTLIQIHRLGIDTVIDLELFSRFTALLTGCSGASRRVGYHIFHGEGLWRGDLLTHRVHYNPHIHISKNFLSLVHAAFANENELPFSKVVIKDEDVQLAQAVVTLEQKNTIAHRIQDVIKAQFPNGASQIILINPNASDLLPQRRWAPERFAELIAAASTKWPHAAFLITGSAQEKSYAQRVLDMSKTAHAFNFAGMVKFGELPTLYHLSNVMVTNDSGPGHFSSVTPLPTVVLFGPETPALYGSLGRSIPIFAGLACSPCVSAANHRKTPCKNNLCMQAIEVPQVLDAMQQWLMTEDHVHSRV
jgi:ADP-heptose:LPS heptosyltransferase